MAVAKAASVRGAVNGYGVAAMARTLMRASIQPPARSGAP